jgi:hypothetical protein
MTEQPLADDDAAERLRAATAARKKPPPVVTGETVHPDGGFGVGTPKTERKVTD